MWSKNEPTEAGWFWLRVKGGEPDAVIVAHDVGPNAGLYCKYHVTGMGIMLDQMKDSEWWPERIQEPITVADEHEHFYVDGQQDGKRGQFCLECSEPKPLSEADKRFDRFTKGEGHE